MNNFSIKDIENLSGIKAHTLRIWEQRYQLFTPKRRESKHRYYDNEDLKHILRISRLYHNGMKISKIAKIRPEELGSIEQKQLQTGRDSANDLIHRLIEASLDFNEDGFEQCFEQSVSQMGVEATFLQVIYPFLEKIGLLWLTDHAIPAQEHFASNLIKRKLIVHIEQLSKPIQHGPVTVLFTPEGEQHEIPLLLTHYLMKKAGKRCVYLGIDLPLKDLHTYVHQKQPSILYFHAISHLYEVAIDDLLQDLCTQYPEQSIVMAGPLTRDITKLPANAILLKSLDSLLQFARKV